MSNILIEKIDAFKNNQECFYDILLHFHPTIKYLSYKLSYPEAETDLIIYLFELLPLLNQAKFTTDKDLLMYINRCLKNKATNLFHKIIKDKKNISFMDDTEILDVINEDEKDEYSDIIFNDLISSLRPKQRQITFYKFYLQLSNIEIAKILKISRQAVTKTEKLALKNLKNNLSIQT